MRYRMEMIGNNIVVRNVETDVIMGWVLVHCARDPRDPNRLINTGCTVLNKRASGIAWALAQCVPTFMEIPSKAVGYYEEHNGYPDFAPLDKEPEPKRVEHLLETTLADIVHELARAMVEYVNGGLTAETKKVFGGLIVQLHDIWFASRFGSWNAERRAYEPYFAHPFPEQPRLTFPAAVREYGMRELHKRFPDESEATLQRLLSWPLEMLDRTLKRLVPA